MKKQFLLIAIIIGVPQIKGIINPMTLYTPITTITQAYQNALSLQQALAIQPLAVAPAPSTPSSPEVIEQSITPASIGTHGQTLHSEGCYQITNSVSYNGTTCALTIAASNITIDFNGQTLLYSGPLNATVHGIIINPGVSNVTIRNGTIMGFPGVGILSPGTSQQPVNHLTLETMKIISCYQGIILCTTNNTALINCITTGNMNPLGKTHGIKCATCTGITIQQCMSNNNTSPTCSCYGFFLTQCKTTALSYCSASGNEGAEETAGIYFENMLRNNCIQSCTCNGNSSTTGESYGMLLANSEQTYVQDSTTQGNSTSSPTCFSYGIRLRNASHTFIKHNTTDGNDYGIYDDESLGQQTNIFTQNIAYHNTYNDYLRPNSSPLTFIKIQQDYLQGMLAAGPLDNISVRISS